MMCLMCKGEMLLSTTTHVIDFNNCIIIIKNVPCYKCTQCGEVVYTGAVLKQIENITSNLGNILTEVAIVEYQKVVA